MHDPLPMPTDRRALLAGIGGLAAGTLLTAGRAEAGPLVPPAAPAPTAGPEPRIAINPANTPGDASCLFMITQPGSYYLTGNITGDPSKCGIKIAASNVTIDLMGFAMFGVVGSFEGITTEGAQSNLVIRNGTIARWGAEGINLIIGGFGHNSLIEGVISSGNGLHGMLCNINSVVRSCIAHGNGSVGILLIQIGVAVDCSASQNGLDGFQVGSTCTVMGCSAYGNTGDGIQADTGCTVTGCSVRGNGNRGILTSANSMVSNCTASANTLQGIQVGGHCLVRENCCSSNLEAGIACNGNYSQIEDNNCTLNGRGIQVTGIRNVVMRNKCAANTTSNWNIAAENTCLVIDGIISGAINGNSGGAGFGSTDPNANYTY
jgi:parallel beta-helix repeat protein